MVVKDKTLLRVYFSGVEGGAKMQDICLAAAPVIAVILSGAEALNILLLNIGFAESSSVVILNSD